MKCFNHEERGSVGICRMCGKALCKECAVSGSMGVTCKGECEKMASGYGDRMAQTTKRQDMVKRFSGYYALIIGILILLFSFFIGGNGLIRFIIPIVGVILIIWSIFLIKKNRK